LKEVGTLINPELNIDTSHVKITDSGDIQEKLELEEAHLLLEERVSQIIKSNSIPFVIGMFFKRLNLNSGGGNDQSYPNALGLLSNKFFKKKYF
jgi:hypothetical protein